MPCENVFCPHEKCSGACGDSSPLKDYFSEEQYQRYLEQKERIVEKYLDTAAEFPKAHGKLFHPNVLKSVNEFNSMGEAYKNLYKLDRLRECLEHKKKKK